MPGTSSVWDIFVFVQSFLAESSSISGGCWYFFMSFWDLLVISSSVSEVYVSLDDSFVRRRVGFKRFMGLLK